MNQNVPRITKQMAETATDYKCEKCENLYFIPVFCLKKISALVSPNGKEVNIPVQTFACSKCSHVNEDFVPKVGNEAFS